MLNIFGTRLFFGINQGTIDANFAADGCDNQTARIAPVILGIDFFVANNVYLLYGPNFVHIVQLHSRSEVENGKLENKQEPQGKKRGKPIDLAECLGHIKKYYKIR